MKNLKKQKQDIKMILAPSVSKDRRIHAKNHFIKEKLCIRNISKPFNKIGKKIIIKWIRKKWQFLNNIIEQPNRAGIKVNDR